MKPTEKMLIINGEGYEWHEGMSIADALELIRNVSKYKTAFAMNLAVSLNGKYIQCEAYDKTTLADGDSLFVRGHSYGG